MCSKAFNHSLLLDYISLLAEVCVLRAYLSYRLTEKTWLYLQKDDNYSRIRTLHFGCDWCQLYRIGSSHCTVVQIWFKTPPFKESGDKYRCVLFYSYAPLFLVALTYTAWPFSYFEGPWSWSGGIIFKLKKELSERLGNQRLLLT